MHVRRQLRSTVRRHGGSGCAFLAGVILGAACAAPRTPAPSPASSAAPRSSPEPVPTPAPPPEPSVASGEACGALDCRRFGDAAAALRYVLEQAPLALGIGEAHAQAGSEDMPSTAARFNQLLPVLAGRASHLIVELLRPNPDCPSSARPLEQAQKPVIQAQSRNNQNDYVALGVQAKALGIEPFVLTPSCEEFRAIADAGEDTILRTLATIASVTGRVAKGALVNNRKAGRDQIVIAYGGALHNDLAPSAARASFCYGDALSDFTGGRYIALDLIVRELIKDNEVWRALPWYREFDPTLHPESSILLRTAAQSYVLFFPRTPAPGVPSN